MANAKDFTKILLDESEMPTQWYNLIADLPTPPRPRVSADSPLCTQQGALKLIQPPEVCLRFAGRKEITSIMLQV